MGDLLLLAGAAIGVAVLVALAVRLGFRGTPRLFDANEAAVLADGLAGGFDAVRTGLDAQGRGALLADAGGRIALVAPHGAHFVARLVPVGTKADRQDGTLVVATATGLVALDLGDAASEWEALLRSKTP